MKKFSFVSEVHNKHNQSFRFVVRLLALCMLCGAGVLFPSQPAVALAPQASGTAVPSADTKQAGEAGKLGSWRYEVKTEASAKSIKRIATMKHTDKDWVLTKVTEFTRKSDGSLAAQDTRIRWEGPAEQSRILKFFAFLATMESQELLLNVQNTISAGAEAGVTLNLLHLATGVPHDALIPGSLE